MCAGATAMPCPNHTGKAKQEKDCIKDGKR